MHQYVEAHVASFLALKLRAETLVSSSAYRAASMFLNIGGARRAGPPLSSGDEEFCSMTDWDLGSWDKHGVYVLGFLGMWMVSDDVASPSALRIFNSIKNLVPRRFTERSRIPIG